MGSRKKKNGSKKKKKNRNRSKKMKKNIVSSLDDLVTRFPQLRLNKKGKGSNSDQLEKDFLKMDVAQLCDPAYPLAGLPMVAKFHIKKAIALMEELEEKPGDLSIRQQLCSARCELHMITPCLKSCGFLSKDWNFDNMDLPSLRFLVG